MRLPAHPHPGSVGSRLLEIILQLAEATPAVSEVYLHVHSINEDALAFYQRCGFHQAEVVQNYYRRIEPRDAILLRRVTQSHNSLQQ